MYITLFLKVTHEYLCGFINRCPGMTRKVYTPASARSEANLIIIGQYVIPFTINRFTSRNVIYFIYKIL